MSIFRRKQRDTNCHLAATIAEVMEREGWMIVSVDNMIKAGKVTTRPRHSTYVATGILLAEKIEKAS